MMANTKLLESIKNLGITPSGDIYHNLSYEELFTKETDPTLEGNERAILTKNGTVSVDTGKFTGRSAKDKYIVLDDMTKNSVWWEDQGSTNKALTPEAWSELRSLCTTQLTSSKKLFVMDGFCGASKETRMAIRLITEIAWQAHFFKNMFIRPSEEELKDFKPDWTILNACRTSCKNYQELGLRSEVFVSFNLKEKVQLIGGTWYGGEIKKGVFSIMNYFLPLKGVGSLHCSANQSKTNKNDVAVFFGLSGTGKTTLSTDPERLLIGDDEHGWDDTGVFNYEGGCYAKTINLSQEKEPDIYNAIKRDALLENVTIKEDGSVDFFNVSKTENTRVSYPIYHIENIVKPVSKAGHAKVVIFLTCDAYGVLPPVSKLDTEQALYQYLSGYTAKVAGTEIGVTEPTATFSACFGSPFLTVHPTIYADILGKKIREQNAKAYLVNTGWIAGSYGVGHRIDLKSTRAIIRSILNGEIEKSSLGEMPIFKFKFPENIPGVDSQILDPEASWKDKVAYDETSKKLAKLFIENFKIFSETPSGRSLIKSGPIL